MSAITSKLENALADIEDISAAVVEKMSRLDSAGLNERKTIDIDLDKLLQNYAELLNQMTKDVINVKHPDSKQYFDGQITEKRIELSHLTEQVKQKRLSATNNPRTRQEQQLMNNANKSQQVNDVLDQTIHLANSNVQIGNSINEQLLSDREHLQNIDGNVDNIHRQGMQGERTAKQMLKRAFFNGLISWIIDLLLLGVLGYSLYHRFA